MNLKAGNSAKNMNPIICADFPEPDVIRVGDTYYMICATMHFFPGGTLLKSYDLVHWEIAAHVFERLDDTPAEQLEGEQSIYGKGMWAASLRYHKDTFYVCFASYDTGKTYIYRTKNINEPWEKRSLDGVYHHPSLLFDEDGRIYMGYGFNEVRILELNDTLTAPKEGGFERLLVEEEEDAYISYEGAHFYKKDGTYYIFVIQWLKGNLTQREQLCLYGDSLDGEFKKEMVFSENLGFPMKGVAQGGIVDTPEGDWYSVMYQEHGAIGKMPVLVPVSWDKKRPVFGDNGKMPAEIRVKSTRPYYVYTPVFSSEIFEETLDGKGRIKPVWQWNHEPDAALWEQTKRGGYRITTGKISVNLIQAVNTLTQRAMYPESTVEVTLDPSDLKDGDFAGLCVLQGCYGWIGVTREYGRYYIVMWNRKLQDCMFHELAPDYMPGTEGFRVPYGGDDIRLKIHVDFTNMRDMAEIFYRSGNRWQRVGSHRLYFKLDHFMGCRYGLFAYSTAKTGGSAEFYDFAYRVENI